MNILNELLPEEPEKPDLVIKGNIPCKEKLFKRYDIDVDYIYTDKCKSILEVLNNGVELNYNHFFN